MGSVGGEDRGGDARRRGGAGRWRRRKCEPLVRPGEKCPFGVCCRIELRREGACCGLHSPAELAHFDGKRRGLLREKLAPCAFCLKGVCRYGARCRRGAPGPDSDYGSDDGDGSVEESCSMKEGLEGSAGGSAEGSLEGFPVTEAAGKPCGQEQPWQEVRGAASARPARVWEGCSEGKLVSSDNPFGTLFVCEEQEGQEAARQHGSEGELVGVEGMEGQAERSRGADLGEKNIFPLNFEKDKKIGEGCERRGVHSGKAAAELEDGWGMLRWQDWVVRMRWKVEVALGKKARRRGSTAFVGMPEVGEWCEGFKHKQEKMGLYFQLGRVILRGMGVEAAKYDGRLVGAGRLRWAMGLWKLWVGWGNFVEEQGQKILQDPGLVLEMAEQPGLREEVVEVGRSALYYEGAFELWVVREVAEMLRRVVNYRAFLEVQELGRWSRRIAHYVWWRKWYKLNRLYQEVGEEEFIARCLRLCFRKKCWDLWRCRATIGREVKNGWDSQWRTSVGVYKRGWRQWREGYTAWREAEEAKAKKKLIQIAEEEMNARTKDSMKKGAMKLWSVLGGRRRRPVVNS